MRPSHRRLSSARQPVAKLVPDTPPTFARLTCERVSGGEPISCEGCPAVVRRAKADDPRPTSLAWLGLLPGSTCSGAPPRPAATASGHESRRPRQTSLALRASFVPASRSGSEVCRPESHTHVDYGAAPALATPTRTRAPHLRCRCRIRWPHATIIHPRDTGVPTVVWPGLRRDRRGRARQLLSSGARSAAFRSNLMARSRFGEDFAAGFRSQWRM